ncbi:hypothetical protein [Pirellula sp. SH-Sr6A]|uniref:hypothetical protein n=1 Tax=Pirellula sp. SH-Sr6A TaxID=1632865 RepID=UPI00143A8FD1|nr:hypothetical protein [Pirellula sp. SH-Sr6A]
MAFKRITAQCPSEGCLVNMRSAEKGVDEQIRECREEEPAIILPEATYHNQPGQLHPPEVRK